MNFHQIKQFKAITEYGSMNAAAKALFVTQSSISQSMKNLEAEFGVHFFDRRSDGRLILNENGRKMLSFIDRILGIENEMFSAFSPHPSNQITLCAGGGLLFGQIIKNYISRHPSAGFNTSILPRVEAIRALLDGKCDALIDFSYIDDPKNLEPLALNHYSDNPEIRNSFCKKHNLLNKFILQTSLYLSCPLSSPFTNRNTMQLSELGSIPLIRNGSMHDFESWVDLIAQRRNVTLNTKMIVDNATYFSVIFEPNNYALIISPFIITDSRFRTDRKLVKIDDELAMRDFYLYARPDKKEVRDFFNETTPLWDYQ